MADAGGGGGLQESHASHGAAEGEARALADLIFRYFDRDDDGHWCHQEASEAVLVTEGRVLGTEEYEELCWALDADPDTGLLPEHVRQQYDADTATLVRDAGLVKALELDRRATTTAGETQHRRPSPAAPTGATSAATGAAATAATTRQPPSSLVRANDGSTAAAAAAASAAEADAAAAAAASARRVRAWRQSGSATGVPVGADAEEDLQQFYSTRSRGSPVTAAAAAAAAAAAPRAEEGQTWGWEGKGEEEVGPVVRAGDEERWDSLSGSAEVAAAAAAAAASAALSPSAVQGGLVSMDSAVLGVMQKRGLEDHAAAAAGTHAALSPQGAAATGPAGVETLVAHTLAQLQSQQRHVQQHPPPPLPLALSRLPLPLPLPLPHDNRRASRASSPYLASLELADTTLPGSLDINLCGRGGGGGGGNGGGLTEGLRRLERLFHDGSLSPDEYSCAKQALLLGDAARTRRQQAAPLTTERAPLPPPPHRRIVSPAAAAATPRRLPATPASPIEDFCVRKSVWGSSVGGEATAAAAAAAASFPQPAPPQPLPPPSVAGCTTTATESSGGQARNQRVATALPRPLSKVCSWREQVAPACVATPAAAAAESPAESRMRAAGERLADAAETLGRATSELASMVTAQQRAFSLSPPLLPPPPVLLQPRIEVKVNPPASPKVEVVLGRGAAAAAAAAGEVSPQRPQPQTEAEAAAAAAAEARLVRMSAQVDRIEALAEDAEVRASPPAREPVREAVKPLLANLLLERARRATLPGMPAQQACPPQTPALQRREEAEEEEEEDPRMHPPQGALPQSSAQPPNTPVTPSPGGEDGLEVAAAAAAAADAGRALDGEERRLHYRNRIINMYERYKAEKLPSVAPTLRQCAGREETVLRVLVDKYGPEPLEDVLLKPLKPGWTAVCYGHGVLPTLFPPSLPHPPHRSKQSLVTCSTETHRPGKSCGGDLLQREGCCSSSSSPWQRARSDTISCGRRRSRSSNVCGGHTPCAKVCRGVWG